MKFTAVLAITALTISATCADLMFEEDFTTPGSLPWAPASVDVDDFEWQEASPEGKASMSVKNTTEQFGGTGWAALPLPKVALAGQVEMKLKSGSNHLTHCGFGAAHRETIERGSLRGVSYSHNRHEGEGEWGVWSWTGGSGSGWHYPRDDDWITFEFGCSPRDEGMWCSTTYNREYLGGFYVFDTPEKEGDATSIDTLIFSSRLEGAMAQGVACEWRNLRVYDSRVPSDAAEIIDSKWIDDKHLLLTLSDYPMAYGVEGGLTLHWRSADSSNISPYISHYFGSYANVEYNEDGTIAATLYGRNFCRNTAGIEVAWGLMRPLPAHDHGQEWIGEWVAVPELEANASQCPDDEPEASSGIAQWVSDNIGLVVIVGGAVVVAAVLTALLGKMVKRRASRVPDSAGGYTPSTAEKKDADDDDGFYTTLNGNTPRD